MNLIASAIRLVEQTPLPDPLTKRAIDFLVGKMRRRLSRLPASHEGDFARELESCVIAAHTDTANAQHYGLPPDFFALTLGPRHKYSCCPKAMKRWRRPKPSRLRTRSVMPAWATASASLSLAVAGAHSPCLWPNDIAMPQSPRFRIRCHSGSISRLRQERVVSAI
jgi:hypothetical protein